MFADPKDQGMTGLKGKIKTLSQQYLLLILSFAKLLLNNWLHLYIPSVFIKRRSNFYLFHFSKLIGCKKGTSQPEARKFLVGHEMLGSL